MRAVVLLLAAAALATAPLPLYTDARVCRRAVDGDTLEVWWDIAWGADVLPGGIAPTAWTLSYQAEVWNRKTPGHESFRSSEGDIAFRRTTPILLGDAPGVTADGCTEEVTPVLMERDGDHPPPVESVAGRAPPLVRRGDRHWLGVAIRHGHPGEASAPALYGGRVLALRARRAGDAAAPRPAEDFHCFPTFDYDPHRVIPLGDLPGERLDRRHFVSPPDSLLLAILPGYDTFRFRDVPVDPKETLTLRGWYRGGTPRGGTLVLRLSQYDDRDSDWRRVEPTVQQSLPALPRWSPLAWRIRLCPSTTHVALSVTFKADRGELWLDDLTLTAVDEALLSLPDRREWFRPLLPPCR